MGRLEKCLFNMLMTLPNMQSAKQRIKSCWCNLITNLTNWLKSSSAEETATVRQILLNVKRRNRRGRGLCWNHNTKIYHYDSSGRMSSWSSNLSPP